MDRRTFLIASTLPVLTSCATSFGPERSLRTALERLTQLEKDFNGRLGVYAIDTNTNASLSYRGNERFAFCSTFKFLVASAILRQSVDAPDLLERHIRYDGVELKQSGYSPITGKNLDTGMSVAELCAAAIDYSDNGAANQLMKILGGPPAVTEFARNVGDKEFRLDRWEPALNSAVPGDLRDTTTPAAMTLTMQRLALGNALPEQQRAQLVAWLRANTTGDTRISAGVPDDWDVGDKTGTGDYGVTNDVGVLWPPKRAPIVLAIFTAQREKDAPTRNDVVASAAHIVADWLQ